MTTATERQPAGPSGSLEGSVALVTGRTRGPGAAASRHLVAGKPSYVTGQTRAVHGGRDT